MEVDSPFLSCAIEVAREAGTMIEGMLYDTRTSKEVGVKRNATDLVTRADRMAEAHIVQRLQKQFPDHGILAEEGTRIAGSYRWIIDPLDGTTNFTYGIPWFAVSIGLEHAGKIIVGVVYHPSLDELFAAERGKGARLLRGGREESLHVSDVTQISQAVVATGTPFDIRESGANIQQIGRLLRAALVVRMIGSAALHMAYVAAGRLAAFWEPELNPWDVAGGSLLVEEAGGRVTDIKGRPFVPKRSDILATNGRVHSEMLSLLNSAQPA